MVRAPVRGRSPSGSGHALSTGGQGRHLGRLLLFGTAGLFLALVARSPVRTFGDSGEYFLMAESLANHVTPDLQPGDLASLGGLAARYGPSGHFGRLMSLYRRGRDGRLYSIHFWSYPALALPLKVGLRLAHLNELKAFPLTNAAFFVAAFVALGRRGPFDTEGRWVASGLFFLSPALWFAGFPHPETVTAAIVVLVFVLWHAGRSYSAILCAAIGSALQMPLALLVGPLWIGCVLRRPPPGEPGRRGRRLLAATAAAAPAALPPAFYLLQFGTPSLLARESAHAANLSLRRTLELFLDLNIGLLPYMPVVVVGALVAAALRILREPRARGRTIALWSVLFSIAFSCGATDNWNHGTSGPSRYGVWLAPLVIYAFVAGTEGWRRWRRAFWLGALIAQGAIVIARGGLAAPEDYLDHSYLARLTLDHWPRLYSPTPEIFAERTAHREWDGEPAIYADGGRCRKALIQKRHADDLVAACHQEPADLRALRETIARAGRGRDEWTYVNFD